MSSRKRLTASPEELGSRPVAGPGSLTNDVRRLRRGTVCQNAHTPRHCTAADNNTTHRPTSKPAKTASTSQTGLPDGSDSMRLRTARNSSAEGIGRSWKQTQRRVAMAYATGSCFTIANATRRVVACSDPLSVAAVVGAVVIAGQHRLARDL